MRNFRRRRRLPAVLLWGLLAAAAALIGVKLTDRVLGPVVGAVAEMEARRAALDIINRVMADQLMEGVRYSDLVAYQTDGQGMVTVLQTNTGAVNRLVSRAVAGVQAELEKLPERRFHMPLGELLRSPVFAHTGPRVPIHFLPVGAVTAVFKHRFEEAGINQTRHLIVAEVQAHIRVVIPLVAREVSVSTELPLAETIIAGRVPQQYWRGSVPAVPGGGAGAGGGP